MACLPKIPAAVSIPLSSCRLRFLSEMRLAPSQAYPSTLTAQGCPSLSPMAVAQGESASLFSPTPALAPPQALPFLWGTSRQIVGLCGGGLTCAHLTNPSLTRHSSGTWPRQGHLPSSPRYSTVLSRPFVVEARFSARPFRSGDGWRCGDIVDHFDGAPIDTGRTGEPEAPCARSGKIMVHDSQTLSLASSPRRAF
jgi:hypothetical protein